MPYEIPFTDRINKGTIVVEDREINDSATSISFLGRQATGYGQSIGENFLHMLENFASNQPPSNPVEGQTWYDTNPGSEQLKVYDGTNWVAAGGIKKGPVEPDLGLSLTGDLWVDTANQQLYLNNGASWLLVGPEFSGGLGSGIQAEQILGTDDQYYVVLKVEVSNIPVAIITSNMFTPKSTIRGYTTLKPGINLTTRNIANGPLKYNGVAETAETLKVGSDNVSSSNFMRGDIDYNSYGVLRIKNDSGIEVGTNSQFTAKAIGNQAIIQSNITGNGIDVKTKSETGYNTVIRATSDKFVGINNTSPQVSLDIIGDSKISESLEVGSTTEADDTFGDDLSLGALVVAGGTSIAKNLKVGTDLLVKGQTKIGNSILVDSDAVIIPSIGSEDAKFNDVYAETFHGFFKGAVEGTITGAASSAAKLTNRTTFKVTGDVTSDDVIFDGSGELTKTFDIAINNDFITTKDDVVELQNGDEILINRTTGDTGIFKITKTNFLKDVPKNPVGMIVPFAGDIAPPGWYICDGTVLRQADAVNLYNVIKYKFKSQSDLEAEGYQSTAFFGIPDLRGRMPLGADNMGDLSADVVTNTAADTVGFSGGSETKDIKLNNLPEHNHDMKSPAGIGHYAIRDDEVASVDESSGNVQRLNIATGTTTTSGLSSSGGIDGGGPTGNGLYRGTESLGAALDIMPPYLTINYIIFADT
jgi:microcystin-dependent protein/carbonic anhydrase/acetyltransferase-like protein (isoleucine patch superfamily)